MKIRHRLIVLLGLPFICQVTTTGLLVFAFASVDHQVARESNAKQVISLAFESSSLLERALLLVVSQGAIGHRFMQTKTEPLRQSLDRNLQELHRLTKEEPKAKGILARTEKDFMRYIDNWEDLAAGYRAGKVAFLAQFIGDEEFGDAQLLLFQKVQEDAEDLMKLYRPIASEFSADAIRARSNLRVAVVLAIYANAFMVGSIALMLNKSTLSRMRTLMDNMHAFAQGQTPVLRLGGDDELAELDMTFAQMAQARNRLDEIRKSMRAMVNHDLRSPLTSMGLRVEWILEQTEDALPPLVRSDLQQVSSEIQRLWRLSNTLLDIEKIEDGKVDVRWDNPLCKELVSVSTNAVESLIVTKKITLQQDVPEDLTVYCDKDRTIQVLVNLISNAAKFAPKRSKIVVQVTLTGHETVRFEVLDEGPGVPEDQVGKLFAKFSQLDQPAELVKQGSGLGLYICKMLVGAQYGSIGYSPRTGGGSCFWLELQHRSAEDEIVENVENLENFENAENVD